MQKSKRSPERQLYKLYELRCKVEEKLGKNDLKDSFKFAKLSPSRWEDYRELRLEAMKSDPEAFGSSYEEELKHPKEEWERRIGNAFFALHEDKPIGMAAYIFRNRIKTMHIADIFSVYVKKEHRGKGVGNELLKRVLSLIMENNAITKVSLTVSSGQNAAIGLYRKHGFEIVGELKGELKIEGNFYDELVMEKFL